MPDNETRGGVIRYGRRKLTEAEYDAQTAAKEREGRQGTRYGNRKGGGGGGGGEAEPSPVRVGTEQPVVSIGKLRDALEKTPKLLDAAIANELSKATPRKGALTLFLETEQAKESPRAPIVKKLETALDALTPPTE